MKSQGLSCGLITRAPLKWGGPPFSAVHRRVGAQSLIAGPQDKQGNVKEMDGRGERVKREIRKKTQKGIAAHVSKGHM